MIKKLILIFIALLFSSVCFAGGITDKHKAVIARKNATGVAYCDSLGWTPTLSSPDFTLDFDHTTLNTTSCGTSDEVGTLSNATIVATPVTNPGSDGNCLFGDATDDHIAFNNTGAYFNSVSGEVSFLIMLDSDNTGYYEVRFIGVDAEDRLEFGIATDGTIHAGWEDHNGGWVQADSAQDIDGHYDEWVQVHIRWDTTRCTQGDGNCADAGEDELCIRTRVDDNADGDFGDGGEEDWEAWGCESSTTDLEAFISEPSTGEIQLGLMGTHSVNAWYDDFEIKNSTSW